MQWPACLPDLNPIKNIWFLLYENGEGKNLWRWQAAAVDKDTVKTLLNNGLIKVIGAKKVPFITKHLNQYV